MYRVCLLALLTALTIITPTYAAKRPQLTPMEVQALQSRDFDTSKNILFASVMSVLQDLGYTVESADIDTGFIRGGSPTSDSVNFFEAFSGFTSAKNTRVTAFVEPMAGGKSKVRLNFVNSIENSSRWGQTNKRDTPVLDAKTYQVAWDKIDEAIFIRSATTDVVKPNVGEPIPTPAVGTDVPKVGGPSAIVPPSNPNP